MADEQNIESDHLDVPLLPRMENYRDPNEILPLDGEQILHLTANHFVSARTLILGQTGKGKGNAGALLTEFLLESGLPLTFVDLEGEGWSFKEICPHLLVVGRSAHADREYGPEQMGRLAELSVEQGFSVVLDLSGYTDEEIFALLLPYLQSLWTVCDRLRTPYHLLLDEVHELIPEEGTTPIKPLLRRIAKRGRKRGLGVIAMSQETASVDKKFLRQTDIRILLSVSYESDLKTYHTLIPGISLETLKQTIPAFTPGTGYVIVEHKPFLVCLRRRRTFDPSETPKLGGQQTVPTLHMIDQQVLDIIDQTLPLAQSLSLERLDRTSLIQLIREMRRSTDLSPSDIKIQKDLRDAEAQIVQLQTTLQQHDEGLIALIATKDTEIARLQERIDLLNQLMVIGSTEGLPSTLSIDHAMVHHLHTSALTVGAVPTQQVVDSRMPTVMIESSVPFNEAKFKSLQERVRKLSDLDHAILRVLVEQNKGLTVKQIAAWLSATESHVQNNPPTQLITLGIVNRSRNGNHGYVYRAILAQYLSREFPDVDIQLLQKRLLY